MQKPSDLNHGPATGVSLVALAVAGALAAPAAYAGVAGPERASSIDTDITDLGGGMERYDYTVNNDSGFEPYGAVEAAAATVQEPPGEGDGPLIVDWELPWFVNGGVDETTIDSPTGWDYAIEDVGAANPETGWGGIAAWQTPGDPFYEFLNDRDIFGNDIDNGLTEAEEQAFLGVEKVLHWYIAPDSFVDSQCDGPVSANDFDPDCSWGWDQDANGDFPSLVGAILPLSSLGGFGFDAPTSDPLAAPYQASWFDLPVRTGDPPFPGDPVGGGVFGLPTSGLPQQQVPEPGTLALAGLGLAGLAWGRRRRK